MNRSVIWSFLLLALSVTAYRLPYREVEVHRYAEVTNDLGYRLQREQSYQHGNQLFSPYGVSTVLSLLYQGARGSTREQLGHLGYQDLEEQGVDLAQTYQQIRRYLERSSTGSQFEEATVLVYPYQYSVSPRYQDVLESVYKCLVQQLDYNQGSENSRREVNRWLQQQTGGKISQIVANVYASSGLSLLNGVYYQGSLQSQYYVQVQQRPFYSQGEGAPQSVWYYETQSRYPYYQDHEFQAVQLPYYDEDYELLVVLPSEQNDVTQVQQQVTYETLQRIFTRSQRTQVRVSLPQFRLDNTQQLEQYLQYLGVTSVFETEADLPGFTGSRNAHVSQVVQRAVVQVGKSRQQYQYWYRYREQYEQQYPYGGYQDQQYQYDGSQGGQYEYEYQFGGHQDPQYEDEQEYQYRKHQGGQYEQYQYGRRQGDQYDDEQGYQYGRHQRDQYDDEQGYQYGRRQGDQYDDEQGYQYGRRQRDQYDDEQGYQYGRRRGPQYEDEQEYQHGGRQGGQYEQLYRYGRHQGPQYEDEDEYQYGGRQGDQYDNEQDYQYGRRQRPQYEDEREYQHSGRRGDQYKQQYRYGSHLGRQYEDEQQYRYGDYQDDEYGQIRQYQQQRYGQYGTSQEDEYENPELDDVSGYVAEFRANRPFLFYVVHKSTGLNLLVGRVSRL